MAASDGDLCLRALRESDLPRVAAWLAEPHVARWWNLPSGLDGVRAKFLPRIAGDEPTHMLVVEERGLTSYAGSELGTASVTNAP